MFRSERMKKVNLLVLERDVDRLVMGLGSLAAIHLTPPSKQGEGSLLIRPDRREDIERLKNLERRLERVAAVLKVRLDLVEPEQPEEFATADEVSGRLRRMEREIDRMIEERQALTAEAEQLRGIVAQVEQFEGTGLPLSEIEDFSFVHFAIGSLPGEQLEKVRQETGERVLMVPFKDAEGEVKILAVSSKKGRYALQSALEKFGFRPQEIEDRYHGLPDEILIQARKRLAEVTGEDDAITHRFREMGTDDGAMLRRFWRQTRVRGKIAGAYENFGSTRSTYLISGWVPESTIESFANRCLELTEHRCVLEMYDPEELPGDEEPPTSIDNVFWLIRPFALLIKGYGYPRYREISPTLLVAVSYFLMFGAMFGDVGQGGVLFVTGLLIHFLAKPRTQKDFGLLIALCGVSAMIFGVLYGSVFGSEEVIEPLWLNPRTDVGLLLLVSIGAGVVVISTGVILNILNKLWTGNWAEGVFGRFGVLGLAFYWGALGLAVRYVMTQQVNPYLAAGMILVPLLLLFLKEPVFFALGRHHKPAGEEAEAPASPDAAPDEGGVVGFFVAVVEGFVEVMEAVLMYVSNTASFMRLAAYAMSHTGLCLVIFALEAAVREAPAGPLWSILLVIVGNLVVIVLEGLVVAVQALRLEYYEFFNKFFSGEGKAYEPFDLKSEGS